MTEHPDTTYGALTLRAASLDDEIATALVAEVQQEYVVRYGGPDDGPLDVSELAPPDGLFLIAFVDGEAIGCAGLRRHDEERVEIKRMYVRAAHRRRGHARRMLVSLEDRARALGYRSVVLETGLAQPEAIALYTAEGYRPLSGFGHYRDEPQSRGFTKDL